MTIENNVKLTYTDERGIEHHFKTLRMKNTPLNKLFAKIEPYKQTKNRPENQHYLSIRWKGHYFSYLVTVTDEMQEFMKKNTFTGFYIEIIQQHSYDHKTKTSTPLPKFLLTLEEEHIIGNVWLDYRPEQEIIDFFNLKEESK